MSVQNRSVQTPEGRVRYDTVRCDNPECVSETVPDEAVAWFEVRPFGIRVETLTEPSNSFTHYCSRECLKHAA